MSSVTLIEQITYDSEKAAWFPVVVLDSYNGQRFFKMSWLATLAFAAGSACYIVGRRQTSPDDVNPDEVQITLKREGMVMHQTSGGIVKGGQWGNLMVLINQLVDQGYTIRSGNIIICGALGEVRPAARGRYSVHYGPLGTVDFELRWSARTSQPPGRRRGDLVRFSLGFSVCPFMAIFLACPAARSRPTHRHHPLHRHRDNGRCLSLLAQLPYPLPYQIRGALL